MPLPAQSAKVSLLPCLRGSDIFTYRLIHPHSNHQNSQRNEKDCEGPFQEDHNTILGQEQRLAQCALGARSQDKSDYEGRQAVVEFLKEVADKPKHEHHPNVAQRVA